MSAANDWCAPKAVSGFGNQLFHRGVVDLRTDSPYTGQADVHYAYQTQQLSYANGTSLYLFYGLC